MKILFLPFLKMPTGHHTVADALIRSVEKRVKDISCLKIDFFSYADKLLERAFRKTYLTWIDHSPQTFVWLYRNFVYPTKSTKHFNWYELIFMDKMKELLQNENPDLIICTQAFPSFLISRLKQSGFMTAPVVNVYTDFFINRLWGIEGIDLHFVPDAQIKNILITKYGIRPDAICVTGIPIDERFQPRQNYRPIAPYHILISGGSGGLGDIEQLISNLPLHKNYYFSVLCGNNKKLYKDIFALKLNNLKPLPYISSKDTMNALYNEADAIITKPGGVTISESLYKRLPVFTHSCLPGQEEINRDYLLEKQLLYTLQPNQPISDQLDSFLLNGHEYEQWRSRVNLYLSEIECPAWQKLVEMIVVLTANPNAYTSYVSSEPYSKEVGIK